MATVDPASTTVVPSAVESEGQRVITWQPYLWQEPKPASPSDLQAAEAKLNVTFPEDYKAVVAAHQGKTPNPAIFRFFSPEHEAYDATPVNVLFHFAADDTDHAGYHLVTMYEDLKERLPEGVIPFGEDPGGSYIAFDFRVLGKVEGATGPYVVYIDHEAEEDDSDKMSTIFLADSFTSFLGQLRTEEEVEAEMENAELVGPEDLGSEEGEEGEEEEGEGGGEEEGEGEEGGGAAEDEEDDDESHEHVAKKRRNEEGTEDVSADAGDENEDHDDDEEAAVGEKRKNDE